MFTKPVLKAKVGTSFAADEKQAVKEIYDQISQPHMDGVLFFCSSKFNLDRLGECLKDTFPCAVIGCTTAGEITSAGYHEGTLAGASLGGDIDSQALRMHAHLIAPLSRFSATDFETLAITIKNGLVLTTEPGTNHIFGLLLVDGMSMLEEPTIAHLNRQFQRVPIVGGSAGDDLNFKTTYIYHNGRFHSDAAAFTIFETPLPFVTFKTQHFVPTEKKLVITEADVAHRRVLEIDGEPAAQAYADILGLQINSLNPMVFSNYPVILRIGGENYVRSIQKVNEDGSLSFYCAIDNGLVLTVAKGVDLVENLQNQLSDIRRKIPNPEIIIGQECHGFVCPAEKHKCPITDLGQNVDNSERVLVRADKETVPILKTATPIVLDGRNHLIETFLDISERKRAELALRSSEAQLSNAMKIAQLGHWEYDVARDLFTFNDHFYSIFRTSAEEVGGYEMPPARYAQLFVHPDDMSVVGEEMRKALETTDPNYSRQLEHRIIYADGETGYIAVRFSIVKDEQGRTVKTYGANQDITARMHAEEEKKRLETQLRQAQKMEAIGTLAGGIAHDFNNIIYPIIGFAEIAMEDLPENCLARNNMAEVLKAAHRAKDMVKHILAFSRQKEQERKPIKIGPVVDEALKLLTASIPTTIATRKNIGTNLQTVLADPTQIHQVIVNLCTNAAHAMRETGGELEVSLEDVHLESGNGAQHLGLQPGNYVKMTVRDTGRGMTAEIKERIFDPYFTTKGAGEGTGMGLSTVHGIVKSHGGSIVVESEPGKGTGFYIFLPAIEMGNTALNKGITGDVHEGKGQILFVDDEEPIVRMNRQMLERIGYQVTARTSSVEALGAFRANPKAFDLVITDMTMPNMTGLELTQKIMEIRPDIPVVLCTGFSETVTEDTARTLGVREYMMKPVVKREMANTIRRLLEDSKEV